MATEWESGPWPTAEASAQRLVAALGGIALVAVAADHLSLVHKPLAGGDARSQIPLVLLQLASLAFPPFGALFFLGDREMASPTKNERLSKLIQVIF